MRVDLSFAFDDGRDRIVEIADVKRIDVQDYVFNGQLRPETALVVDGTAYELRMVSDIRLVAKRA